MLQVTEKLHNLQYTIALLQYICINCKSKKKPKMNE